MTRVDWFAMGCVIVVAVVLAMVQPVVRRWFLRRVWDSDRVAWIDFYGDDAEFEQTKGPRP